MDIILDKSIKRKERLTARLKKAKLKVKLETRLKGTSQQQVKADKEIYTCVTQKIISIYR